MNILKRVGLILVMDKFNTNYYDQLIESVSFLGLIVFKDISDIFAFQSIDDAAHITRETIVPSGYYIQESQANK